MRGFTLRQVTSPVPDQPAIVDDGAGLWRNVIVDIVDKARKTAGNAEALSQRLERHGVNPERGRYSTSAVSNWAKGRTTPPADVLLALAVIAGVSIDATLAAHNRELVSPEIVELRKVIENLQSQVAVLNSHTGLDQ